MKHITLYLLLLFLTPFSISAQTILQGDEACIGYKRGIPDPSAVMDVVADNKGILIPRVDNTSSVNNPALGLLIFDKSTNAFQYYNGDDWVQVGGEGRSLIFGHSNEETGERNRIIGVLNSTIGDENNITGAYNRTDEGSNTIYGVSNAGKGSCNIFGSNNRVSSYGFSVFGRNNNISSDFGGGGSAFGHENTVRNEGVNGNAIGRANYVSGSGGNAFGSGNGVYSENGSAFGYHNSVYGKHGSAFGYFLSASVYKMTAIGSYNEDPVGSQTEWINTDPIFAVGNGKAFNSRSTALTILKNGNTGIGTTAPDVLLDVAGDGRFAKSGTLSSPQLTLHQDAGDFSRMRFTNINSFASGNNDFFAIQANVKPASGGDGRFYISYQDDGAIQNILTIQVEGSNKEVGINDDTPDFTLDVNGTAGKPGGGDWSNASDRRLKKDIEKFEDGLEQILKIRPVWYRYNGLYGMPTKEKYVGIIAQEMQKVAPYTITPYLATNEKTGNQKEFLSYNGTAVTYMLVNAIQEQQEMIEEKEEKIVILESRLARLEAILLQNERSSTQKEQLSSAQLQQNAPNPFNGKTNIQYYVPEGINTATLRIADTNGRIIKEIPIAATGEGQIELEASTLNVGNYFYSLLLDGQLFETKQMILQQ